MVEITFTDEHDEAYANLDDVTGKPLGVYFHPHSPLAELFANHAGHNPLFVHADEPAAAFEHLRREYNVAGSDLETMQRLGYAET